MADNKRSKKLIGGILGGPKRANDAQSPNKKKSAPNGILGKLFKAASEDDKVKSDNARNKKIALLGAAQAVEGVILPGGSAGVVQGNNIIPIGGDDTAGTLNQDANIVLRLSSNQAQSAIFVNGENTFKTTPNRLSFKLSDVIKDGVKLITLQKEGYTTNESYVIKVVNNPDFQEQAFDSYENQIIERDGVFDLAANRQKRIFTKTSPYSFKIEYYKEGVLQTFDGAIDNNEIKELPFELNTASRATGGGTTAPINTLIINLEGPDSSALITKNDGEQTKLLKGKNVIAADQGSTFQITSSNLNLYKLNRIQATRKGYKPSILESEIGKTVSTKITLEDDYAIDITSEQFANIVLDSPVIDLVNKDEIRKYNINTKSEYPIHLNKIGNVTKVTAFVGDKTYTFDNLYGPTSVISAANQAVSDKIVILMPAEAFLKIGNYKIIVVPNNADGDGDALEIPLTVVDEVYVGVPDLRNIQYPSELVGPDYVGTNVRFDISFESVNTDYVRIYVGDSTTYIQEKADGSINLNFQELLNIGNSSVSEDTNSILLKLKLVPYNISGHESVVGKTEIVSINFKKGANQIPRNVVINRISDAFASQLDDSIFADETSKYLTHLLHIGNGDNKVITTWTGSQGSLILKLYEPLATDIQPNQEVWISKLISNPIVETITLIPEVVEVCNTLKGPNFSVQPDNGIEYQIYSDLVASGSVTSTDLVNQYATKLGIDTEKLNIEYVSGSDYTFENFINFSCAEERLNNFFYKIKLIEFYKNKFESLSATTFTPPPGGVITENGYQIITEDGLFDIEWEIIQFAGVSQANEARKVFGLLNEVIRSFDGYEKFLYTSPNPLAYPKDLFANPITGLYTYVLKATTNPAVTSWYDNLLRESVFYDKYNPNFLVNNIPAFIREDSDNSEFLTFLNMMGQHFDIIWSYINGLARVKKLEESQTKGIANDLVQHMLESMGWENKKAFDSQFLWEYAFGTYKDGFQKYSMPLKDANDIVWRRILNNLPYILKHKGTGRAMKAIMACYGVPQSMLTIMEFGGPQDPTKGGSTKFTFDDRTAAIQMKSSSSISIPWHELGDTGLYPQSIEFRIKPDIVKDTRIISSSQFNLDIIQTTGSYARLDFKIGDSSIQAGPYFEATSSGNEYITSSIVYVLGPDTFTSSLDFPLSTENYSNVLLNKYTYGSSTLFEVILATSDGTRITTYASMSLLTAGAYWESGSSLSVGNTFSGSLDEFRLWRVPLQASKFQNHTLFPDAINGNSYTASTEDLLFRLDFEYPKDRTVTENAVIKNVAINQEYGELGATGSFIYSASAYPYQYIPYDRTVTANVPSIGFGVANKIRFEEQTLVTDLSYKTRATKKSFDQAPIDSNRLGLFFSPIKELNMDILKAFGDFNIDNYIGDPSDEYKDTYRELDTLREYYFQRLGNRNINEYIQLVRYIDKSLFDVLADLAPARAKVSKGLLIEPHYLERSKTKWKKAESERNDYDTSINVDDDNQIELSYDVKDVLLDATNTTTFEGTLNNYNMFIDNSDATVFEVTNPNYDSEINYNFDSLLLADAPFYDVSIACPTGEKLTGEVDSFQLESIGMDKNSLANLGYGAYARNGVGIIRTFDGIFGNSETTGSRKNIYLVKEQYITNVSTQIKGYPTIGSVPGERVLYADIPTTNFKYKVSITPFSTSSLVTIGNEVVEATPLNGYFPTHYKYVNNLSEGLNRSFWKGSKQGLDANGVLTTPDGLPAVEIFTTNPNILRVAKTGRGSGEPILEVD
jgi:hypothetical protein